MKDSNKEENNENEKKMEINNDKNNLSDYIENKKIATNSGKIV